MSQIAHTPLMVAPSQAPSAPSPFFTIRLLRAISGFVDANRWVAFAAVSLFCGWGHMNTLAPRHLDHDELFTFYIAQAPTLGRLLQLTRTIDLHPPLSYLLVRLSFAIFGVSSWSCRLPFFLAFLLFGALVFFLVSRIVTPLYGLLAILILWISPYSHLATEARSYSMVLCFTSLMLVSWYELIEGNDRRDRRWAYGMLVAGGFGLLLSQLLGALAYGSFWAAEAVRFRIRRRPDWRLWAGLLLPLPSVLAYLPLIRTGSTILFSPWVQPSPRRVAACYWEHLRYLATPFALLALIVLAWPLVSKRRHTNVQSSRVADLALQWLLLFLFLVPLEIGILFARTGTAFFERYGVVALIPCALVPVIFLANRTHCARPPAEGMAILLTIVLVVNTSGKPWLVEQLSNLVPPKTAARLMDLVALPPIGPPRLTVPAVPPYLEKELYAASPISHWERVDPGLPLVAGSGTTFLELDTYQDAALTGRLYLLTNHEAAATITHNTVFDHYEPVTAAFPIRGQVQPYCTFLREHSQFLVLGGYNYPDTWLLRKLEMDGARLSIVGTYNDGVVEEHQVYRVSIDNAQCGVKP